MNFASIQYTFASWCDSFKMKAKEDEEGSEKISMILKHSDGILFPPKYKNNAFSNHALSLVLVNLVFQFLF